MDFLAKMLPQKEWEVYQRKTLSEEIGKQYSKALTRSAQTSERANQDIVITLEKLSQEQNRNEAQRLSILEDALERNGGLLYEIQSTLDFGFRSMVLHLEYQSRQFNEIIELLKVPERIKDAHIYTSDTVRYYRGGLWKDAYESINEALKLVPKNPFILELAGEIALTRKDGKANQFEALELFKKAEQYSRVEEHFPKQLVISIGELGAQAAYFCEDIDKAVKFSRMAYELDPNDQNHVIDYSRFLLIQGKLP
jgi:tetratricopeptide (TPR) repeat protein